MTEITGNFASTRTAGPHHVIDPVAFFLALIGGPVLVTAISFWLVVPVFALIIGGPLYLAVGTPVLLWRLQREVHDIFELAVLAMKAVGILTLGATLYLCLTAQEGQIPSLLTMALFALVFAALWTATFGWLYRRLCRDFFTHPIPN
jgi:hypothetical protein